MWGVGAVRRATRLACAVVLLGLIALLSACDVQSIEVTPSTAQAAAGTSAQLVATAIYASGVHQDVTGAASWSSSNSSIATVGPTGIAAGVASGSANISASLQGVSGSISFTVTSAVLVSIVVTPATPSVPNGTTQQFTATGIFSDNSTEDLTHQVSWASSTTGVATISSASGSQGLASTVAPGSTTISATSGSVSGSTALTVTAASLVSIALTPASPSIPKGLIEQFTATGTYTDGSTQNLTAQVIWSSSNTSVATLSNASGSQGLASTVAPGSTTISATSGSVSGSTALTVTAASLVSIALTPASPSIPKGLTERFTATGLYTDNTTQNLTTEVTWSSSSTSVATLSNASGSQGLASTSAVGSSTISATLGGISGSTTLTVSSATLLSIAITPPDPSVANGISEQFTATGTFTDNSTQNLTTEVTWASSSTGVATVSNASGSQGLASTSSAGSSTISATLGAISGSTTLTVSSATLVSIAVTPANPSIANGLTEQFTATGTFTDNSTQNLTTQVTWSSSNSGMATVSNASGSQGLASTSSAGSSTISATLGAISGSTTLTVSSATLVSIAVTPANPSIANGLTEQFTATGTFTDNSTQNLTTQVTWSSSNSGMATVSNASGSQGLASTSLAGSSTISATLGSVTGSTTLTVTSATLVSIAVTPANPSIANGLTEQFTATGTYTDNSTQNLSTQVTWTSSDTSVATISNAGGSQGLASSAGLGSTTVWATSGGISGGTGLTVTPCGFVGCEILTIDHTKVGSSDSSAFPMLFSGAYAALATVANGGLVQNLVTQQGISVPADALFASDSACTLPVSWEVESYDASTGAVNIWVSIPTLSHTVDTVIYLCVGNPSVSAFQGGSIGAAWDSNYQAVYHFPNGIALSAADSTSNGGNGTIEGATATSGEIGGAASIVNSDEIVTPYVQNSVTAYTIEAWINSTYAASSPIVQDRGLSGPYGSGHSLTLALNGAGACGAWGCFSGTAGVPFFAEDTDNLIIGIEGPTALNDGNWHHLVGTWSAAPGAQIDPSQFTLFVDGTVVSNPIVGSQGSDVSPLTGEGGAVIGYHQLWGTDCNCSLDEVRISTVVRSADWITAEYNNQSSPSTFYTVTTQ